MLKKLGTFALIVAALLVAARAVLPSAIGAYVNSKLAANPNYSGAVGEVEIKLREGWLRVNGISIQKTAGSRTNPLLDAHAVELRWKWNALFDKKIVASVSLDRPDMHAYLNTGPQTDVRQALQSVTPFLIESFTVRGGRLRLYNAFTKVNQTIDLSKLEIRGANLITNMPQGSRLPATLRIDGKPMGAGTFHLEMSAEPFEKWPTFTMQANMAGLPLEKINPLLLNYLKIRAKHGTFDMDATITASNGAYRIQAKPDVHEVEVFGWQKQIRETPLLKDAWDALQGLAREKLGEALESTPLHAPLKRLGEPIEITGRFDSRVSLWKASTGLLREAFVKALVTDIRRYASRYRIAS